jgi:hypothetical protein
VIPIQTNGTRGLENIPGTTLPYTDANSRAFSYIRPLITATGGLSLSQICTITGLEGSTIQNWVKRGWIGGSFKSKKYDERQVATILIFTALRSCLQFESIAKLIAYVNAPDGGATNEGDLFSYMCEAVREIGFNIDNTEPVLERVLNAYNGENRERLKKALTVMVYACICTDLSQAANLRLMQLIS